MKQLYKYIAVVIVAAIFLPACKKDTTAHVSKIFNVPIIVVNGDAAISIPVGTAYTDAGAKYNAEDGSVVDIQSSTGSVDINTPGLYTFTYEQESASGIYHTVASRNVAVTSVNDAVDYSGTYLRALSGIECFVSKVGNGFYEVQNPGGAGSGLDVVVYFVETAKDVFICPDQETTAGTMSVNNISFTATGAEWAIVNDTYGPQQRFFDKE